MTKPPDLIPVLNSSNIHALGFDPATKTLAVQFKDMRVYLHHGVSDHQFEALKGADSVGKHYHTHIRGRFETTKLDQDEKPDSEK